MVNLGIEIYYTSADGIKKLLTDELISIENSLAGLSDVDLTTVSPVNGDILVFNNGTWKPSAGSVAGSSLDMIDLEGTEKIELLTPQSINKLEATTDITTTSIPIKWNPSPSPDIKDYNKAPMMY